MHPFTAVEFNSISSSEFTLDSRKEKFSNTYLETTCVLFSLHFQLVRRRNLELQSDHFLYVENPFAKECVKKIQTWEAPKPALRVLTICHRL